MYGIHRIEKRCRTDVYGIQLEANRTVEQHLKGREFPGSDIDWLKTKENVFLVKNDNWWLTISDLLKEKDIKPRKNSVVLLDSIYTASAEFFQGKSKAQIIDYFKACLEFHEKTYGEYVINCVIHFDEVKNGNIHCHIASCPIIEKKNGTFALSARDLMGGRDQYRKRQDEFYNEVSSLWGLERGEVKDYSEIRKHIDKMEYEKQEATIKAQRAKAELNIRERVLAACQSQLDPIEIVRTREHKLTKEPTTVEIKVSDFEKLKEQVSASTDLKNGLKAMEQLAKEAQEALAIDEKVIEVERELQLAERTKRAMEMKIATLNDTISKQINIISETEAYIGRLEYLVNVIQNWAKEKKVFKSLMSHLERMEEFKEKETVKYREREIEIKGR